MTLEEWQSKGQLVDINGYQLFVVESGKPRGKTKKPTLVILHGFPTSSLDYHLVWPQLTKRFRVIVHDHLGFGFSQKPRDYSYSLLEQAEMALNLWQQLGVTQAHLLAHDYGTSVATEILARRERFKLPVKLQSVTLCNGSMHIELARLRILQVLLRNKLVGPLIGRLSSKLAFTLQMKRIWFDTSSPDLPQELENMWACIQYNDGRRRMHQIIQYLRERYKYWHRWIGALTRLDLPCHVCWAKDDPVAVAAIGQQVADETPTAKLTMINNLGHYPMIEDPERWLEALFTYWKNELKLKL